MCHPALSGTSRPDFRHDHRSLPDGVNGPTAGFFAAVRIWAGRHRAREALRDLAESGDRHLLADIGVTREEALRRAGKWFWQG